MKLQGKLLLIPSLLFLLSSCRYYYTPNAQQVPLFRERNEFRLGAARCDSDISTRELQAAYSVTNNIAVSAAYLYGFGGSQRRDTAHDWGRGTYVEGAVGYFKPIGKSFVFETYLGYGRGQQHHQYGDANRNYGTADLRFKKTFLQPSFGYTRNAFDAAVSFRTTQLNFDRIDNRFNGFQSRTEDIADIENKRRSFLIEPAVTVRGGWKFFKVQFQIVFSQQVSAGTYLPFQTENVNIGLYISLAKRYRIIGLK